ncbi:hypothetical protein CEXT_257701 [Caerostris extrusa]|uniref:Uncharacterized protein n=1 Tax=Caerostris extrusa TaxID=172846 RepID=A0AAV4N256_CAEEX|nr:hypothetical protein CEXT_257701 [Caerostris extrusa]
MALLNSLLHFFTSELPSNLLTDTGLHYSGLHLFGSIKQKIINRHQVKIIHIVITNPETLTLDEMIVQPTTEQYELGDNFLKPIVNFEQSQSQSSLITSNEEIASVTIELRKPTIDHCFATQQWNNIT